MLFFAIIVEIGENMVFFNHLGSGLLEAVLGLVALVMALFIAIPFHEFAHAWVAKKEGDYTAVAYKRCTPEAFAHFDICGFLMMLFFGFGWAKPVPINSNNFKRGRKSQFLVSVAGIVMNLLLGIGFLFIYMLILRIDYGFFESGIYGYMLELFLYYSFSLNFGLAFFNLLPIYPFDGYNMIDSMCRYENAYLKFAKKYSLVIFILLIITGIYDFCYGIVIENLFTFLVNLFSKILGL